jgi:biotin-(acetyl-CoA carboxylase) ligase
MRALDLPPPFRLITLREVGDAFAHAQAVAATEGAGTLVHVGRFDVAELAVVLEPDEPLRQARRALYAGLNALADALAVAAPPEKPISFEWPDAVLVDGGVVGGARLAWPADAREDEPSWLVFGATVRLVAMTEAEPGLNPLSATLADEGFSDVAAGRLVESFARHLMVAVDAWQEAGFAAIMRDYLSRLPATEQMTIDGRGDLLIRHADGTVQRRDLRAALAAPSWLRGGPA